MYIQECLILRAPAYDIINEIFFCDYKSILKRNLYGIIVRKISVKLFKLVIQVPDFIFLVLFK